MAVQAQSSPKYDGLVTQKVGMNGSWTSEVMGPSATHAHGPY